MTGRSAKSELGLGRVRLDKRNVGNAVRDDLDLVVRHPIDAAQQFAAFLGHHDDLRGRLDDSLQHRALDRGRLGQHGVQRRHHRHGEARQQRQDVGAGFAAENSEFVLQAHGVEPAGVQEICGAHVLFDIVVLDLQSDRRRIIVDLTMIGHRHDAGLQSSGREVDIGLLQVGREGCNSAAAGQRIADEGDTAERRHVRTSISLKIAGRPERPDVHLIGCPRPGPATRKQSDPAPDRRSGHSIHRVRPRCWSDRHRRRSPHRPMRAANPIAAWPSSTKNPGLPIGTAAPSSNSPGQIDPLQDEMRDSR